MQNDFASSKFPMKRLTKHFGSLPPVFLRIDVVDLQSLVSLMDTQSDVRSDELNVAYSVPIELMARYSSFCPSTNS